MKILIIALISFTFLAGGCKKNPPKIIKEQQNMKKVASQVQETEDLQKQIEDIQQLEEDQAQSEQLDPLEKK